MMLIRLFAGLSLSALAIGSAHGQTATNINASTGALDAGTAVSTSGNTTTISGGSKAGGNLFHSFADFDLASGDIASWLRGTPDASTILNIVNRVTGGSPSDIDGTLMVSDMPNANFYFINPAGIFFGAGASVNVPNAAYFSTAQELRFAAGPAFTMTTPGGSTFSSAAPESFGFLGAQGNILTGGQLNLGTGGTVSLSAANVTLMGNLDNSGHDVELLALGTASGNFALDGPLPLLGDGEIRIGDGIGLVDVRGSDLDLAASRLILNKTNITKGGTGRIRMTGNGIDISNGSNISQNTSTGTGLGTLLMADTVRLTDSFISSLTDNASDATAIVINAGNFIANRSGIASRSTGTGASADIVINANDSAALTNSTILSLSEAEMGGPSGAVNVIVTGALTLAGSSIQSRTLGNGAAGTVDIRSGSADLSDANILSESRGAGNANDISFTTGDAMLANSRIASQAGASGNTGNIRVTLDDLTMTGLSAITSSTDPGTSGNAGDIVINANSARLSGLSLISSQTQAGSSGQAGSITMNVTEGIELTGKSGISALTSGSGNAGFVDIKTSQLRFLSDGDADSTSVITSNSFGTGKAGFVTILAQDIQLGDGTIATNTTGPGLAGGVTINTDTLTIGTMQGTSGLIISNTNGAGNAGTVAITAGLVELFDGQVNSLTTDAGNAGKVTIDTDMLRMSGGFISSSALPGSTGNAGDVLVIANNAELSGTAIINSDATPNTTGNAGDVSVNVAETLSMTGASRIAASTRSTGQAGVVKVVADTLTMSGLAGIAASTSDSGKAGNIFVTADNATVSGNAQIASLADPGSTGDAGLVDIKISGTLRINDMARISAATSGPGNAGSVTLDASQLVMRGGEITSFTSTTGHAGNVVVTADNALLSDFAIINSEARAGSEGQAGNVTVAIADELIIVENANIAASAYGKGDAGSVTVSARNIMMASGSIASLTDGEGKAGNILVTADNAQIINSAITSEAFDQSSGDAGIIVLDIADQLEVTGSTFISASTFSSGSAGSVEVTAQGLQMMGGEISSFTRGSGDAGQVNVTVDTLEMSDGQITSNTSGTGNAGNVRIIANFADLGRQATINSIAFAGDSGDAGTVNVEIGETLFLAELAEISASTFGTGQAGSVLVTAPLLIMDGGRIASTTTESGNAGSVSVTIDDDLIMTRGIITSSTESTGNAGDVFIGAGNLILSGGSSINSSALENSSGDAGSVIVRVTNDIVIGESVPNDGGGLAGGTGFNLPDIAAFTAGTGDAGTVDLIADRLIMAGGSVYSSTYGQGNAGTVMVDVRELDAMGGEISSLTRETGNAGQVSIRADTASIAMAQISSASIEDSTGNAGSVSLDIDGRLTLTRDGLITSATTGSGSAGDVQVSAGQLILDTGAISSVSGGSAAAGAISIDADNIQILNGSRITTNSAGGPAGDITLTLPDTATLLLAGEDPGIITTSSGTNTGGRITISNPYLILSDGGNILALGQQGGANVVIRSSFFIRSADRPNLVSVNGSLVLDSQFGDQITGTEAVELPFLDASGILSGQCAGSRSSGRTSRFIRQITGPYSPVMIDTDSTPAAPIAGRFTLEPCG